MGGPNPISRQDIRLWAEDEGVTLEPWERRALLRIDGAWLDHHAQQQAARNKGR